MTSSASARASLPVTTSRPPGPPHGRVMGIAATEAWHKYVIKLDKDEIVVFDQYSCNDPEVYLQKIQLHCKEQRQDSRTIKLFEFVRPLYDLTALLIPGASIAVQAYPNPGCLIMGGLVLLLQVTEGARAYQRMILQTLNSMSTNAGILLEYDLNIYEDELQVQRALVDVYGDMLDFCHRAFRSVTRDGELKRELKPLGILLWHSFRNDLQNSVKSYASHMEKLEAKALMCDKKRIKMINETAKSQSQSLSSHMSAVEQHFKIQNNLLQEHEKRAEDYRKRQLWLRSEKNYRKLLHWLSRLDFETSFMNICEYKHLPGTGQWLLENETYQRWKYSGDNQLLWVHGKPGCGKSVLAAVTISDLQIEVSPATGLAYALCSSDEPATQDPTLILRALVRQLLAQKTATSTKLEQIHQRTIHPRENGPTFLEARELLVEAVSLFAQSYLIIDALDECKDTTELTKLFTSLLDQHKSPLSIQHASASGVPAPRIKIIIFSRRHSDLTNVLGQYDEISLDNGLNDGDLATYIHSLFPDGSPALLNKQIRDECLERAKGMFLWVKLVHQGLEDALLPESKLEIIKDTPPELPLLYNKILNRIANRHRDHKKIAYLVLLWIENAGRPMSGREMLEAVTDYTRASHKAQAFSLSSADQLVSICQHLVATGRDGFFRLCHDSLRNYLQEMQEYMPRALVEYQELQRTSKERLARISLSYLRLGDFRCGPARSPQELRKLFEQHPFLFYLSDHLNKHLCTDVETVVHDEVLRLFELGHIRDLLIQFWRSKSSSGLTFRRIKSGATVLHLLALFGLRQIAETLAFINVLSRQADSWSYLPIHMAMHARHRAMSLWLIENTLPVDRKLLNADNQASVLHLVSRIGWTEVVTKVVVDEPDVDGRAVISGQTALHLACEGGHVDTASVLLSNGADCNLEDNDGGRPLIKAVRTDKLELVRLLLQSGARVNDTDYEGATAVHYASDNPSILRLLLDHGANPSIRAKQLDGQSALHCAASNGSIEALRMLYKADPKPETESDDGSTPLHFAAWNNKPEAIRVLIELGANADATNNFGTTPLHIAVQQMCPESVVALLKTKPAITDMVDKEGATPLHHAVKSGRLDMTNLILNSQPKGTWKTLSNMPSNSGETTLYKAVISGNQDILQLMLDIGADTTRLGSVESSVLHYAAFFNHSHMIEPLVQHGCNINARNENQDTVLHFAARSGHIAFVKEMFDIASRYECLLELNAQNKFGSTPLHTALTNDHTELAVYLINKEAISKPDLHGDYPIHIAANRGLDPVVRLLVNHEGFASKGFRSRSVLLEAVLSGKDSSVRFLLDHAREMINEPDQDGDTPMLAALRSKQSCLAHCLLDHGADHSIQNTYGQTLLHYAAFTGDEEMFQRLLNLDCQVSSVDIEGRTPHMLAAQQGHPRILEMLVSHGFSEHDQADPRGCTSMMRAASQGHLEVCRVLQKHGAKINTTDDLGHTAAYYAAAEGQLEVLMYLESQGGILEVPNVHSCTALTRAARSGFVQTVAHLIKKYAHMINEVNRADKSTPLSCAAAAHRTRTVTMLLDAGADPCHEDILGLSTCDYAISCPSLAEAARQAGIRYTQLDSGKVQWHRTLRRTIVDSCESMLPVVAERSVVETEQRLNHLNNLAMALQYLQDYDKAMTLHLDLCWPPDTDLTRSVYSCDLCYQIPTDSIYICKSCTKTCILCKKCHLEYQKSNSEDDNDTVESLRAVRKLEMLMQRLRYLASTCTTLYQVAVSFSYFPDFCNQVRATLDQYESWEGEHNTDGRFNSFSRPGQKWLRLITSAVDLLDDQTCLSPDSPSHDHLKTLEEDYRDLSRSERADQELTEFLCNGHEYLVVSRDEKRRLQADGRDLHPDTGKVTTSFLQKLRDHYRLELIRHADDANSKNGKISHVVSTQAPTLLDQTFSQVASQGSSVKPELSTAKTMLPKRSWTDLEQKATGTPLGFTALGAPPNSGTELSIPESLSVRSCLVRSQTLPSSVDQHFRHTYGYSDFVEGLKLPAALPASSEMMPEPTGGLYKHKTQLQGVPALDEQSDRGNATNVPVRNLTTDSLSQEQTQNANHDHISDQFPQSIAVTFGEPGDRSAPSVRSVVELVHDIADKHAVVKGNTFTSTLSGGDVPEILVGLGYPRDGMNLDLFWLGLICAETLTPGFIDHFAEDVSWYLDNQAAEAEARVEE